MSARIAVAFIAFTGLTVIGSPARESTMRAQVVDPCGTATSATRSEESRATHHPEAPMAKGSRSEPEPPRYLDAIWAHRQKRLAASPATAVTPHSYDAGDIAVVEDSGDLVVRPNAFDLKDRGIRFVPDGAGGYIYTRIDYAFRQPLGTATTLGDDDSREERLRFDFAFFGRSYDRVFVNSDGNLTFDERDLASTERSVTRLLEGPPRVAPFFADLDPSAAGRVMIDSGSRAYTVTWCGVPVYGSRRRVTAQVALLPDGVIEIQSSSLTTAVDAIVGVAPGRTSAFTPVDLSIDAGAAGAGAVGERFTTASELDTVATMRQFFESHQDRFDTVVIFTDSRVLNGDGFAYEMTIANDIQGINLQRFDGSGDWGSEGALQSLVMMDALDKYPDDPHTVFLGSNSTLSVLGQEFGHRWLAFFTFRDAAGRASRELLGRDAAHWSFFMDSDASVMEGNDIDDLGNGSFQTVGATKRYGLLDQYAMGLIPPGEVPPLFYVENPREMSALRTAASAPEVGVTFKGTRRNVTIDDIIAVAGDRVPSAANSKRDYRQAFVYVTSPGRTASDAEIAKLERIRMAWDQFVSSATDSRLRVQTRLSDP
jgi:hypothetical protein